MHRQISAPHPEGYAQPVSRPLARISILTRKTLAAVPGLVLLATIPDPSAAQLRLAPIIGDGMVMQRHKSVPVWGWTDRDDTITVTFNHRKYTAVPDTAGQWTVKLPPLAAGGPYEMTVAGKQQRLEVQDILIGDVWICSGQSNMRMQIKEMRNPAPEIAAARDPKIRHFKVKSNVNRDEESGVWGAADSLHVSTFTAAGYFFARDLRKSVDVPIGLINVAVGGSNILEWVTEPGGSNPDNTSNPKATRSKPELYDRMVRPLLSYPIKGILWYQGEANAGTGFKYRKLFAALIQDWRRAWGLGDIPFLFVQLPNYGRPDTIPASMPPLNGFQMVRESQSTALRLPNTAQIVTIDIGEANDIHPSNKQDVGARLALAARKLAYGQKLEYSGPLYRRHSISDGRAVIAFDHVGRGLAVGREGKGAELQGFAIAGADRKFVWATAKIEKDRVIVWSDQVPHPIAVRYAWAGNPDRVNLYNKAGLPASPFRTDDWLACDGRPDQFCSNPK